ncbi:cytochrome c biogenesis protein ResB [Geomonas subterranea]|uniref:Cytochrome c biogenesis protein ResB n=1 Tax=Geomonas subterranea TaxID=2847989 RepID=A0ABX8LET1_9BACT|nr:cytochrome c biogenesis protein ResB [Geomonas subterranea]QXE90560.1 cytochrome c biogenesis protein ResB [Geomonas subterranea]QXM11361.1 cytochrome c biogenesis protein ResB [Geomonas subterranea]
MAEIEAPDNDSEGERFPLEPRIHPVNKSLRAIYDFLASAKLAMVLLVAILTCCVVGVTLFRGQRSGEMIFDTMWFNGLLVFLIVNVACCFFGRIWGRRVTLTSFGMILFHLSFVAMFIGIIYNSLFFFRGSMRLTEGETVQNGERQSYDQVSMGRFFNVMWLKGETTLNAMHLSYKLDGVEKKRAYDITVGEGEVKKQETIYLTKNLKYRGFKFFPDQEGYSVLTVLYDKQGKELYGAYVPLQSLKHDANSTFYTTGTKAGPGSLTFPYAPEKPLFDLQVAYRPDPVQPKSGTAFFMVKPLGSPLSMADQQTFEKSQTPLGALYDAGEYRLSAREVRYWVSMKVSYEPGQIIVLSSLWVGLFGMILTTAGRMLKGRRDSLKG